MWRCGRETGSLCGGTRASWNCTTWTRTGTELDDLAEKLPDKVAELRGLYDDWAANSRVIPWEELLELPRMAPTKLRLYQTLAYKK